LARAPGDITLLLAKFRAGDRSAESRLLHARAHKGGSQPKIELDEGLTLTEERTTELLALDEALIRLAECDPRQARVVELRFFGGLSEEEAAEVLGISTRTVKRDWSVARAWLYQEINRGAREK
jgi:RNA polymerase sigma factor (TIGR02999 family)